VRYDRIPSFIATTCTFEVFRLSGWAAVAMYRLSSFPGDRTVTSGRIIAATILFVACSREPVAPPGIHFPTYDADGPQDAGLLDATLEVNDGCVYLAKDGERWLGLWPNDFRAELAGDHLQIVDGQGDVLATEGEPILAGGGERRASEVGGFAALDEWFAEIGGTTIPRECGDLSWQVSEIEPR
jgi:hypothetical protein